MENLVHTFKLNLNWRLISRISQIDRFDASWSSIEKREGQSLKQLKAVATVRSVGASTRIEGSKMTDAEVEALLKEIDITKLHDRDSQEVAGYFEVLDIISESYQDIMISESDIKNLHNILMKYSTTDPGYPTQDAMRQLMHWYNNDHQTHPLVKCALFAYDFVSIHPFQDGNGRLSRLIATLLLMKNGYKWVQYVSFEHEIENRKTEYYRVLRGCQARRPNEDVTEWVNFFFDALVNIQEQLMKKLEIQGTEMQLSPREKSILTFIGNNPGCKSGEIARKLKIPGPTVKRILPELIGKNLIEKFGIGPGTNYSLR
jgi:Fic family protein